jgi:O-antigen ligase
LKNTLQNNEAKGAFLRVAMRLTFVALFAFPLYPLKVTNVLFMCFSAFTLINYFRKPFPVGRLFLRNLVFVIPFIPYLIEFCISGFDPLARFEFEKKLLFFTAPFIISLYMKISDQRGFLFHSVVYTLSVSALSLYTFSVMLVNRLPFSDAAYENGAYLLRSNFEIISGLHPTYYSIFAVFAGFSLPFIFVVVKRTLRIICVICAIILFFSILFIAVKIAIITAAILMVVMIFKIEPTKSKKFIESAILLIFLAALSFSIPSIRNRFGEIREWASGQPTADNTIAQRQKILDCSLQVFSDNLWTGTGNVHFQEKLNEQYVLEGQNLLKERNFNPHNQFLTIGINYGIFMLIAFIICFFIIFRSIASKEEGLFFSIAVFLFFLSESLLERQMGVYFFCLFAILFYNLPKPVKE